MYDIVCLKGELKMNERIKDLRKELGLSQTVFAEKLGLTKNYISLIENGQRNMSAQSIKVLCSLYNVNEDWLRNGSGDMFIQKSKDKQIADLLSDIQLSSDDSFKHRLISALARLDSNGWEQLEKLLDMIYQK